METNNEKKALAIVGLIINIILLPGAGSLLGGKKKEGFIQLILILVSIPLFFIFIGVFTMAIAWIWGIITGVEMIKESEK